MLRIPRALIPLVLAAAAAPCSGQGFVNVYEIPSSVSLNVIMNQLMHERLNKTLHHWDRHEAAQKAQRQAAAAASPPPARATGTQAAAELAGRLPKHQADAGRQAYRQAFDYHEQVIRQFKLPSGDLGVAFASCIAGAWMAYHNRPFPDEHYLPLVAQMRRVVGSAEGLRSLSAQEQSSTYEQLAIAGMLLASSQIAWERQPRGPQAQDLRQRMRTQGGETLSRMLGLPPDRVGIGPSGVVALKP